MIRLASVSLLSRDAMRWLPLLSFLFALSAPLSAAPPAAAERLPAPKAAAAKKPEIVEMLTAVLSGSQMGPGEGWFHPSQSRYDWKWLAARYDADHDGAITRKEFAGPSDVFDRLDRDHDGVLKADDFDWSDNSKYAREGMAVRMWFSQIDANSNGRVSKEEWEKLFAKASKGKAYLTSDDLREAFPMSPPARPKPTQEKSAPREGPSMFTLIRGLMSGELGSFCEGPAIGQPAPEFALKPQVGDREVRLSQFKGKKPVVLVFGSFT
jgi:EF hand